MKKILFLLSYVFILISCSNTNYIKNYGKVTEEVTRDGKIVTKYENLTKLENEKIVIKTGYEINNKFTGSITYKDKIKKADEEKKVFTIIEKEIKEGEITSIKVQNYRKENKNRNLEIYNGIFKEEAFYGTVEKVLISSIGNPSVMGLDDENGIKFALVYKEKIEKETVLKRELMLKVYCLFNKNLNIEFPFWSEETLKDRKKINIVSLNNYVNSQEIEKFYMNFSGYTCFLNGLKGNKEDFLEMKQDKKKKMFKFYQPLSLLMLDKNLENKKFRKSIKMIYEKNKINSFEYYIDSKLIDSTKYLTKEKEETANSIIQEELNNISFILNYLNNERIQTTKDLEKHKKIYNFLETIVNEMQMQENLKIKSLNNNKSSEMKLQDRIIIQNLDLDMKTFQTNSERERVRMEMLQQTLKEYYGL